jgi:hypothetical protein
MRSRALSDEGVRLYLHGISPSRSGSWARGLVCGIFTTDYDERIFEVVQKCYESTMALAAAFDEPNMRARLDLAVVHTVRLMLSNDGKSVKKRQVRKSFRFFMDVMVQSLRREDHQTVHMLYLALTHRAIVNTSLKMRKKDTELLEQISCMYGPPIYENHVKYMSSAMSDHILPSLIAFQIYISRREFKGQNDLANAAREFMTIYKYLEHNPKDILPLYNQELMSTKQIGKLSNRLQMK